MPSTIFRYIYSHSEPGITAPIAFEAVNAAQISDHYSYEHLSYMMDLLSGTVKVNVS